MQVSSPSTEASEQARQTPASQPTDVAVCSEAVAVGFARCYARLRTDLIGLSPRDVLLAGLSPSDLLAAYKLPTGGLGQTVAIVDAFDDPSAEADLGLYRANFGLPPCTTANGCSKKVNQNGVQGSYPSSDIGWAMEISLNDLAAAVDTAAFLGPNAISNSYGGHEFRSEASLVTHYNHPGIAITASSGDSGYGVQFPAASWFVTAVGGTHLVRALLTVRGWKETAWSGAGSGCSAFIIKPSWQVDPDCSQRTVADVSAVADPATGVAVYNTFGEPGWLVEGGTSVASPIVASVYALAGNGRSVVYGSYNGSCGGSYLCTAGPAYDGPTGLGTPKGGWVRSKGTVGAWGDNGFGELGNGTNTGSNVPVPVSTLSGVIAIAGGQYHSLAIVGR